MALFRHFPGDSRDGDNVAFGVRLQIQPKAIDCYKNFKPPRSDAQEKMGFAPLLVEGIARG
jgi:hypothetical protein